MRMRGRCLVLTRLFVSGALAGNGDWYTGPSAGSISGPANTSCDCGQVTGAMVCSGSEAETISDAVGLTMEANFKAHWDGEEPQLCQHSAVEKEWKLQITFYRGDGTCDNNRATYDLKTSVSGGGVSRQLDAGDSEWWWNSAAEFAVDSVAFEYKTDPELENWEPVPSWDLGPQGPDALSDLRAKGGDAGNPYGIGPNGEQGTPQNPFQNGGDKTNNDPADAENPSGPHSHTTVTYPTGPVSYDPYREPEDLRWTGQGWDPAIDARVVRITITVKGKAGGTHGDNCRVENDYLNLWLKFSARMVGS